MWKNNNNARSSFGSNKTNARYPQNSCNSKSFQLLLFFDQIAISKTTPHQTLSLVWFCLETETHFFLSPSPFLLQDQHKARLVLNYLFWCHSKIYIHKNIRLFFLLLRFFYLFILIFIYFVYNVETTPIRKEREWMWTLALPPSHGVTNACPKSLPVLAHAYGSTEVLATCRLILAYGLVLKSPTRMPRVLWFNCAFAWDRLKLDQ